MNLPPKQIAKHYRAQQFNERVWQGTFFSMVWCEGPARDCTNLHMLDEGTWVRLLPLLTGRTFSAIKVGFVRWSEPRGFPE